MKERSFVTGKLVNVCKGVNFGGSAFDSTF